MENHLPVSGGNTPPYPIATVVPVGSAGFIHPPSLGGVKRRTSRVWKYFNMANCTHYRCLLCGIVGPYINTTNMRKHIQNHHSEKYQDILDHTRPTAMRIPLFYSGNVPGACSKTPELPMSHLGNENDPKAADCSEISFLTAKPPLVAYSTRTVITIDDESKGVGVAGNSSYSGYTDVSGGENAHCDDVSVDLSPDQILLDDGDLSRTSATPPPQRPESFKLSHNNHLSIVLDSLASDESFMDVTLTAQGKSIKAHKSVLSAVSPYFKSVLRENPCQHPIIIMPRDITFEQLKNIIAYVYKGEMTVAASELSNLLKTAELLQVSGLSPSETPGGGSSFSEENYSPQQSAPSKWMDYSSSNQRKTPVKTAKPASKKRARIPSGDKSPSPKRTLIADDSNNEITCVKEELQSGNEFEELDYHPTNSAVDDPGDNSVTFSIASEASIESEDRPDDTDPLLVPKTESDNIFECAYCDQAFTAKLDQEAHMKTSHPNKQICVCSCGKSFETPVDLEDHKQSCLMI